MGAASERQVEANRRNAERSTGPRSARGKARSRANGLKHGLAAEILVPGNDRAAYEATLVRWEHQAGPDNVAEHHLIRRAAVASVTLDRLDEARESTRQEAARDAVRRWERTKQHAARRKAQDLKADPGGTVSDLEATAFGCDWLIRRWEALDGPLAAGMEWTRAQLGTAQRLLGYPDGRPGIDAERPLRVLWLLAGAMAPVSIGTLPRTTAEAPMPTDPGPARAQLRRFVAAQVDRLEELRAEAWEALEGPEYRAVVIRAAAADTTEEGRLRHRYATDADRVHNAAMRLFYQTRGLRRKEYLAIAKEGRQSGKLPRVPVGGGWWREVDSDPAPPGYARVDPIAAAVSPGAIAAAPAPAADPASVVPAGSPLDDISAPPADEAAPTAIAPAAEPAEDASSAPPAGGMPDDPAPDAPIAPADRPAPAAGATAPGAPRRSEPDPPAAAAGDFGRNPNLDHLLRNDPPAEPISIPRRTEPLPGPPAGPGPLGIEAGSEIPAPAADRRADPLGAPRRSEPDPPVPTAGDPGWNPNRDRQLGSNDPRGPISGLRRTEPSSGPGVEGRPPARRAPDLASAPRHRRRARRR